MSSENKLLSTDPATSAADESEREHVEPQHVTEYSQGTMSLVRADQARLRIREEMERKKLVQREIADLLQWSQSRLAKVLTGRVSLTVDDLEALCFAVGLPMVEVLRDRGMEFLAEMTPTELRILERIRELPQPVTDAILTMLNVSKQSPAHVRRAAPVVKKKTRNQ